jgi:hypothetical protein
MNERVAEFFGFFETREVNRVELQEFADLIRADEREIIFNLVQKIAARFYKDDAEKAFEELTEAIRARGNT